MGKAMAAMKAMRAMKKKRVSKIGRKFTVFKGSKAKTSGGLSKADLIKNKNGKNAYKNIKGWTVAVQKAKKALGVKGFIAIKKGTPVYKKAKELYTKWASDVLEASQ